jgi:glycosyltransferase involved in cell wall biosynthesis
LVVAAGRLAPVKRFELLLDAAAEARSAVPGLRVRILGEGPSRVDLTRWIGEHGAEDWVELTGHVSRPRLRDHYREAWIVASASLAEGWGLSLTEAAACGTPAVATDIRGHRSSVLDGRTGVLVPPADLGRTLADVLADADRRAELADAALARARTLTWDATSLGILRVFHRVVMAQAHQARRTYRS